MRVTWGEEKVQLIHCDFVVTPSFHCEEQSAWRFHAVPVRMQFDLAQREVA